MTDYLTQNLSKRPSYSLSWFDWFCIWYPPGWLILFNRHWQHYHDDPDGWNWLEYGLFLIPGGFYLALLLRWLRLGCRSPKAQSSAFDPDYQRAFRDEVLAPIVTHYFRAELHQAEHLPQQGPVLIAMNHAGMCFPWDFLGLGYLLSQARGWVVQPLAGTSLFEHGWVRWWLPAGWTQTLGGVPADRKEFETAIAQSTILLYAPEGLRGPQKGWGKRHQLETFHPSFVQLSDRHNIPIMPVICQGNETLHPVAFNLRAIADLIGLPFLPVSPWMVIFLLFPSMGVWANRSHLRYFVQPVQPPGLQSFSSSPASVPAPAHPISRAVAYCRAQQFRCRLQEQLQDKNMLRNPS
jgi:1-acyl-sn-glycerol-3-phosphate acyltransferase